MNFCSDIIPPKLECPDVEIKSFWFNLPLTSYQLKEIEIFLLRGKKSTKTVLISKSKGKLIFHKDGIVQFISPNWYD